MKNYLIVKLSAIGDVIHALPVAYALKEAYPDCHITWVVEPPAFDLVNMSPYIDEVILFEKKKFKSLGGFLHEYGPLKRKIRQRRYDAVLDLQGLFKSAAIARLGQAPVKLGMCNMRELSDRVSRPVIGPNAHGHIVERYLDVARALGCPDSNEAQRLVEDLGLSSMMLLYAAIQIEKETCIRFEGVHAVRGGDAEDRHLVGQSEPAVLGGRRGAGELLTGRRRGERHRRRHGEDERHEQRAGCVEAERRLFCYNARGSLRTLFDALIVAPVARRSFFTHDSSNLISHFFPLLSAGRVPMRHIS